MVLACLAAPLGAKPLRGQWAARPVPAALGHTRPGYRRRVTLFHSEAGKNRYCGRGYFLRARVAASVGGLPRKRPAKAAWLPAYGKLTGPGQAGLSWLTSGKEDEAALTPNWLRKEAY